MSPTSQSGESGVAARCRRVNPSAGQIKIHKRRIAPKVVCVPPSQKSAVRAAGSYSIMMERCEGPESRDCAMPSGTSWFETLFSQLGSALTSLAGQPRRAQVIVVSGKCSSIAVPISLEHLTIDGHSPHGDDAAPLDVYSSPSYQSGMSCLTVTYYSYTQNWAIPTLPSWTRTASRPHATYAPAKVTNFRRSSAR